MTNSANLATEGINVDDLCSYAVDVWVSDHSILTDEERLLKVLRTAAEKGNATVLGEASHVFPNGAVTAILLLSASHLSIHTWPEFSLANVDLLAYGRIERRANDAERGARSFADADQRDAHAARGSLSVH